MKSAGKIPSDRSFGFTFAAVFAVIGAWFLWDMSRLGLAAAGVAVAFAAVAATVPRVLHPLNVVWMRFGMLLNKIVSPIVLGVVFLVAIVPVAIVFRLTKRDVLNRALQPDRTTYWVDRTPPGPPGSSFPRQF